MGIYSITQDREDWVDDERALHYLKGGQVSYRVLDKSINIFKEVAMYLDDYSRHMATANDVEYIEYQYEQLACAFGSAEAEVEAEVEVEVDGTVTVTVTVGGGHDIPEGASHDVMFATIANKFMYS